MIKEKLIIEVGAPGAGKSTCARKRCQEDSSYIRINRDDIRTMGFGISQWTPEREKWVKKVEVDAITAAFHYGFNAIVDSTNLLTNRRSLDWQWAKLAGHEIEICDHTDVPLDELIRRDNQRTGKDRVGRVVIERLLAQAGLLPKTERDVLLCCLDGFLVDDSHRKIYASDEHKFLAMCDMDAVRKQGAEMIKIAAVRHDIWMISTRPDFHVDADGDVLRVGDMTALWLESNSIPFKHLFMRRAIDKRSDAIVLEEIVDMLIKPKQARYVLVEDGLAVHVWNNKNIIPVHIR